MFAKYQVFKNILQQRAKYQPKGTNQGHPPSIDVNSMWKPRGSTGKPMSAQFLAPDGCLQNWALPPTTCRAFWVSSRMCANRQECKEEKSTNYAKCA